MSTRCDNILQWLRMENWINHLLTHLLSYPKSRDAIVSKNLSQTYLTSNFIFGLILQPKNVNVIYNLQDNSEKTLVYTNYNDGIP